MSISFEEKIEAARRHAAYYLNVLRQADDLYEQGREVIEAGIELFELEWTNIEAGQRWAEENSTLSDEAARLCSSYSGFGAYLLSLRQHAKVQVSRWGKQLRLLGV
jgi:hypothetical protein